MLPFLSPVQKGVEMRLSQNCYGESARVLLTVFVNVYLYVVHVRDHFFPFSSSANERLLQLTVRCHKRAGRWHNWHITLQALSRWECLAFWKLHVIGDRVQEDIWSATGCTTAFNFQLT